MTKLSSYASVGLWPSIGIGNGVDLPAAFLRGNDVAFVVAIGHSRDFGHEALCMLNDVIGWACCSDLETVHGA